MGARHRTEFHAYYILTRPALQVPHTFSAHLHSQTHEELGLPLLRRGLSVRLVLAVIEWSIRVCRILPLTGTAVSSVLEKPDKVSLPIGTSPTSLNFSGLEKDESGCAIGWEKW